MQQDTTSSTDLAIGPRDVLTRILREGARKMLAQAVEQEVADYLAQHADHRDEKGHRLVVRNGYRPARSIQTPLGPIEIQPPRIDDRRRDEQGRRIRFTSQVLPPYLRRTKSLEELLPWLYLKGISTGDYQEALQALLGPQAPGLSASTIVRLKEVWRRDWEAWSRRSLADKRYVYFWVDGVYFNVRLEQDRQCILVVMGATAEGKKELVAIADGFRENEQSWLAVLRDLKQRGLAVGPQLAVGDGALGFWKALRQVYPDTREQRCWVHKTVNVLNHLPKSLQPAAKSDLQEIWMAPSRQQALKAWRQFDQQYRAKYPKAVECLEKDREALLAFYDFPAEHWVHLRTTNPIESTFGTVRLRTSKTKGCGSRQACLTMVFQLARSAERSWRTLNGAQLLMEVIQGVKFVDGIKEQAA
ncbi:MAG: IS256 family transposase [Halothiobacillaceae bacterium]